MTYYERRLRRYYMLLRLMVLGTLVDITLFLRWFLNDNVPAWVGVPGVVFFAGMSVLLMTWCGRVERMIARVNVATLPSTYVMRVLRKEVICPARSRST